MPREVSVSMLALRAAARRLRPAVNTFARAQRRCGHDGGHHEEAYLFGIVSFDTLQPQANPISVTRARPLSPRAAAGHTA